MKKVRLHSQQTFYATRQDMRVLNLLDHHHKFTVEEVIEQYELRCEEPASELDPNTGIETEMSKQIRFEAYDDYEFDNFGLSRLKVESLLSPALMEQITTRYDIDKQFETYLGKVLFMMALGTCNASVQRDIAGAQKKYEDPTLDSFKERTSLS